MTRLIPLAMSLVALTLAGCYKSRESSTIDQLCVATTPDYQLSLRASTDTVDFRGEVTQASIDFEIDVVAIKGNLEVGFDEFKNDATYFTFDPRGDGKIQLPVTDATFSFLITQPNVYRPTVQAGTCRQASIVARAAVVARRSFAPILTVETIPDISLGVDVGQEVIAIFSVVDRDGSKVFDLTFDPDGSDGPLEPIHKSLWDISIESTYESRFSYVSPGLVSFEARVVDEQSDQTIYQQPAAVGLVGLFDGLVQNTISISGIKALRGYSTEPSETVWAVSGGPGGLKLYAYDSDDGAIHIRGQLAGNGPDFQTIDDLLFDPVSRLGWVSVSNDGLYSVDLTDVGKPIFRSPYVRHYPVYAQNVQRRFGMAQALSYKGHKFGIVANNAPGDFHLLRFDSSELLAQRDSGLDLDEQAVCQITDAKLFGIRQCDCTDPDDACERSRYAEPNVGAVQDIAWMPPYLAFVGDSQLVRLFDASDALTGPKLMGDNYSLAAKAALLAPSVHGGYASNYGTGITGRTNPENANFIDWYIAHNDHGLSFARTDITTHESYILPDEFGNFHAERRAGLIGQTSIGYDSFRAVRFVNDQVVIGDQFGETRSSLLVLNPDMWLQRDPSSGFFHYEYSQKCIESDIWGDGSTNGGPSPITYLTDCIPMIPEKLDVVDTYAGVAGGDRLYVASIGDVPVSYTYSEMDSRILGDGQVLASMVLNGQIANLSHKNELLFVARSLGGLEVWDLSETNSEARLLPRIVDGVVSEIQALGIWPVSEQGVWVSDFESFQFLSASLSGKLSALPVTDFVLPEPYTKVVFNPASGVLYGLSRASGAIQVVDTTGSLVCESVNMSYSDISISNTGQVVGQRYTQNGAIAYEWISSGCTVQALLQQTGDRSQYFVAHGANALYILETTYDGTVDSNVLRVFMREGQAVSETHTMPVPVNNAYRLAGVQLKMVGSYLAVLFKGTNRGVYLFNVTESNETPEFVASALRADLGLMELFHPMPLGDDIAIVGASNGGFHAGKLDFVRFLFNP